MRNADDIIEEHLTFKPSTFIDLSGCGLETLPNMLFELKDTLELLVLDNNDISELDETILEFEKLSYISVEGNPIINPPREVVESGIDVIKSYLEEIKNGNEEIPLNEIKLILIGEGRVGKTSIAKSLVNEDYVLLDELSTHGINIMDWDLSNLKGVEKDEFKVHIWDFGGQEIYHATHQFFITEKSIYLLITEPRKEDKEEDFYYWLNLVNVLGGDSPLYIIHNKCDLPTKDIQIKKFSKLFENVKGLRLVSCLPDRKETIVELRKMILDTIRNKLYVKHIGQKIPSNWLRVRTDLETLRNEGLDFIYLERLFTICKGRGIGETGAISLSTYLHEIGVILHFHDNGELRNTVILNPDWVTEGIYKILDNQKIKDNYGRFSIIEAREIWRNGRFDENWQTILGMMYSRNFDLCYKLSKDLFLAPQLLPKDEPDFDWNYEGNLMYIYRYDFMPKGFLPRLIVKLNEYIHDDLMWRYGVFLRNKDIKALVVEDYYNRTISVRLEKKIGDVEINKRRLIEFLGVIKYSMKKIHKDFEKLSVSAYLPCCCNVCITEEKPHLFAEEGLERRKNANKISIECEKSFEDVPISNVYDHVGIQVITEERYEVEKLLIKGEVKSALDLLKGISMGQSNIDDDIVMLMNRLERRETDFRRGIIDYSVYNQELNKIVQSILGLNF